jgi:hypothetical protein
MRRVSMGGRIAFLVVFVLMWVPPVLAGEDLDAPEVLVETDDTWMEDAFETVEIHGFVSQGFLWSDENNFMAMRTSDGTFEFNEIGINFSMDLDEDLHVGLQLLSRDQGNLSNNELTLDWAFGDYRWRDWLGLRVGKMKVPLGLYNETRDFDMLRTSVLLPQSFYQETFREVTTAIMGVGLYGHLPADMVGSFDYQVQYGTFNIDKDSGVSRGPEASGFLEVTDYEVESEFFAAVTWNTPLEGLRVASSIAKYDLTMNMRTTMDLSFGPPPPMGPPPLPAGTTSSTETEGRHYTFSAEYTWEDLVLAAEYINLRRVSENSLTPGEDARLTYGWYAGGSYRVNDWFEVGAYYSVIYWDGHDEDGDKLKKAGKDDFRAWHEDIAVSTRFDLNDNWCLKVEGHLMDGGALVSSHENDEWEKNWFLLAVKVSFTF